MIQDVYAPNYSLPIFEGQGVKHALGYGVVTRVEQTGLKRVKVLFESGHELICDTANLKPALMPENELEFLRAKHGLGGRDEADNQATGDDTGEEAVSN